MTIRPYCLRCGSSNVSRDFEPGTGEASIGCMMCGNRQYRGGVPGSSSGRLKGRRGRWSTSPVPFSWPGSWTL